MQIVASNGFGCRYLYSLLYALVVPTMVQLPGLEFALDLEVLPGTYTVVGFTVEVQ